MTIKPIRDLLNGNNILKANKIRRDSIKQVAANRALVDLIFENLVKYIEEDNFEEIKYTLSYKLFFEDIHDDLIKLLTTEYQKLKVDSLEEATSFIENLKFSYILKGVNGYVFSFMPIIHKRIH